MTAKELKEKLLNIPNDAKVFLECDQGQNKESAGSIVESRSSIEEYGDPDSIIFNMTIGEKTMMRIVWMHMM